MKTEMGKLRMQRGVRSRTEEKKGKVKVERETYLGTNLWLLVVRSEVVEDEGKVALQAILDDLHGLQVAVRRPLVQVQWPPSLVRTRSKTSSAMMNWSLPSALGGMHSHRLTHLRKPAGTLSRWSAV